MVEIILRKDIQDYEARPLFGFTYRQVATGAAIAITAAGMGLAISSFTEINTLWLMLIMSVCGAIGLVARDVCTVDGPRPAIGGPTR